MGKDDVTPVNSNGKRNDLEVTAVTRNGGDKVARATIRL